MFYVYVLYSEQFQKIYIGFTSDLKARFESHNKFSKKGYTLRFRPWIILHSEEFPTKPQAMKREKELNPKLSIELTILPFGPMKDLENKIFIGVNPDIENE